VSEQNVSTVYHFTNVARLPWMLRAGELRPGANAIGNYPHPEFVWATTDGRGSRSSTASQGYRKAMTLLVRISLLATGPRSHCFTETLHCIANVKAPRFDF